MERFVPVLDPHAPPPPAWPDRVAAIVTLLVVVGTTVFVFVQLDPGLIFGPNMDVGGDNAGHIAAAAYLIHDLLPHLQLSGWDPQWFGGFPIYVFYFPLPALIVAVLYPVLHYAVAFKVVTILGMVLMPLAAYLFGRLAGFARPVPALMAAAMLAFLFNTSYTIDGGNVASTLAGEFSFTLGVAIGLIFLGVLSFSLRTGRLRWLAALLFAMTVLCHVVPGLFFAGAAVVLTVLQRPNRRGLHVLGSVAVVGVLIPAFFLLPFGADLRYTTCMCYTRVGDPLGTLFPVGHTTGGLVAMAITNSPLIVYCLGGVGVLFAAVRRDRVAMSLCVMAGGAALSFLVLPASVVYNGRWLPFWFLSIALLSAYGAACLGSLVFGGLRRWSANDWLTPVLATAVMLVILAAALGVLPGYTTPASAVSFVPSWVSWNYTGYQAKAGWPQFEQLINMFQGAAKVHGCGRLDYEYSANVNNLFGSTIVEMSFPYWTNGCIDSSEGLYYESSTSSPFHFLDQSELSINASNPIPGLPYQPLNVADGIRHLQLTGVKYFLANSPTVETQANADPALVEVGSIPATPSLVDAASGAAAPKSATWNLYLIQDSALVTPLTHAPVVEAGLSKPKWLATAISWYGLPADWSVPIATNGPPSWTRVAAGSSVSPSSRPTLKATAVRDVTYDNSDISFKVTTTGVPVLVKVPYFPNWHASGATGPWLVSPNLMVVVPTSHDVTLRYGPTTADWLGRTGSVAGIAGLVALLGKVPGDPEPPPPPIPVNTWSYLDDDHEIG